MEKVSGFRDTFNTDMKRFLTPEQYEKWLVMKRNVRVKRDDTIHVPSVEEMKAGAKIEVIEGEELMASKEAEVTPSTGNNNLTVGSVTITADDTAFKVYSDGAFVGNSPAKLKLSKGSHVIEVKKVGFKDYKKAIQVLDGSELNLKAVLEKE